MATRHLFRAAALAIAASALVVPFAAGASAQSPGGATRAVHVMANPSASSTSSSGKNGRIAFSTGFILPYPDLSGHSQVFTVNPDGTDDRRLTHVPAGSHAGDPDWSPDGTNIAYVSNISGNFEVWVMNADGSGQHRIAGTAGFDYFTPRWSPNGTQLVVSRCDVRLGFTTQCHIVVMRADGSGRRTLVGGHRINADPEYSPDGRRIAFDSDRAGFVSAVWVVNSAGGGLHRVTKPALEAFWPDWSPQGDRILFTSNCCRPRSQVFVMRADGTHVRQLTHFTGNHQGFFASYSPNGHRIVLTSNLMRRPGPYNDLYTMRADGSHLARIVADHPRVALSDWGPTP
jgi:Tol biopolymer transport system component